ncbi:ABC transporter ATP-binding protein [Nitrosococcus wardiae]|uniref:ABC transporter ATP-binding protein n=1 Tax=Nitrosococcus wardiae TaxID=1814290 RepID=A0A4P7BUE4_9GAMM|nr:ABC transporter ATP-binding protein [Nitrosococcus wardiae]QBQ53548.1 ABC transporter ATP-binding protein [Nitrosococcus wardiae]
MRPLKVADGIVLSVRGVGVTYRRRTGFLRQDRFEALRDVSFDLYQGESLGVIGSNGAGKSTLLKVLSGIILPDKGKIINPGHSVALLSLRLGFDPNLSGRDNAIVSGLLLGFRRKQVEEKLDEIIAFAELESFIDYPLHTYSAGMRARLGFSVAFHMEPDILLIDEVLGVGDADFQRKSRAEMERKIASDKTIVLVSHSAAAIRKLCNRAVWVEQGKTRMEGEVKEVVGAYEAFVQKKSAK